ncbi:cytochrome P450 4d10-like isoform X1 [Arctopsyche grandis]|uniref:cytochrome P450 4d10-like isoform X1 n=2 Tax=Arctopsyche grandis TaxID=121162 RepID=UPI00406D7BD3
MVHNMWLKEIFLSLSILIGIAVIKWLWNRKDLYVLSLRLPGPVSLPLIGSISTLLGFIQNRHLTILQLSRKYTSLFRIWLGPNLVIIATQPEDIKNVFGKDLIAKPPKEYGVLQEFLGNGLFTMSGLQNDYKLHKKIIVATYGSSTAQEYHKIVIKHCKLLFKDMKPICNRGVVDVGEILLRFTADVVSDTSFGTQFEFRDGKMDDYLHSSESSFNLIVDRLSRVWYNIRPIYKMSNLYKLQKEMLSKTRELAKIFIEQRRQTLCEKHIDDHNHMNAMDALLNGQKNGEITEEDTIGEVLNLWHAGFDTSSVVLQLLVMMLAMHKECQAKFVEEIKQFFENNEDAYLDVDDFEHFPYLEMCFKETLRLFPPGPLTFRYCSKEFSFEKSNLKVPVGTYLLLSSYVTHRNPKYWNSPNEFHPERFSKELESESNKRHPFTFFPYSGGMRKCIGRNYSRDIIMTTAIYLFKDYEIVSDWKMEDIKLSFDFDCRFVEGYKATVQPRIWS